MLGAEEVVVVSATAEEVTQIVEVTRIEVVVGIEDVVVARSEAVVVARTGAVQIGTTSSDTPKQPWVIYSPKASASPKGGSPQP